jgi:dTDP-glucose 4,6-dehydratase
MGRAAIVNFLAQAHQGEPILVHADAERCWCWIKDTVRGIRLIAESDELGPFNVGRDDNCVSMYEVAKLAKKLTGSRSEIQLIEAPGNQVLVKRLRCDRLRELGWEPTVELEEGMRLTYHAMLDTGQLQKF